MHSPQLFLTARLKSTGVVENISIVVRKDEFILNVVITTLSTESSLLAVADKKYAHPTSIVGSSITWIDYEIETTIGNERVPDGE